MIAPRWAKILGDIWANKLRSALAILSVALGVASAGTLLSARAIIPENLDAGFRAVNPSSASVYAEPFGPELVGVVGALPEVREAEGRFSVTVRLHLDGAPARYLLLQALPDYDASRINRVKPNTGAWPPPEGGLLLERASLAYLSLDLGDVLPIEMPDGRPHDLRIEGTVHDLNRFPVDVTGVPLGYVSHRTLAWLLGQPIGLSSNELLFTVAERAGERAHIRVVAAAVREVVEQHGSRVAFTFIPPPNEHFLFSATQTMLLLLSILGIVTLLMGSLLVVNVVSALLAEQTRQIGVMKAIGAKTGQLLLMYLSMVAAFGLVAVLLALPVSIWATGALVAYIVERVNFDVSTVTIPWEVLALQVAMGLLVPMAAALVPILASSRITVREAISSYGIGSADFGRRLTDRLVERIRILPRPLLLSLRNAFRRKTRMGLTLAALVLAGAFFIAVLSVRDSLQLTTANEFRYMGYDVEVHFASAVPSRRAERVALEVPGVAYVESWGMRNAYRMEPDGTESGVISVIAPPAGTRLVEPIVLEGRWLEAEEDGAVVIGSNVARSNPDLSVGGELELKIDGRPTRWRIVGLVQTRFFGVGAQAGPAVYVNAAALAGVVGEPDRAGTLRVVAERNGAGFQEQLADNLEVALTQAGFAVSHVQTVDALRAQREAPNAIIVGFLMMMTVLLAVAGGLGLAGTMTMNVLERTREIGVMRAVGASKWSIFQIVMGEGIVVVMIGWGLGSALSLPVSYWLSELTARELIQQPVVFSFAAGGMGLWLAIMLALATVATSLPAWRAMRITVRDALSYQ